MKVLQFSIPVDSSDAVASKAQRNVAINIIADINKNLTYPTLSSFSVTHTDTSVDVEIAVTREMSDEEVRRIFIHD